MLARQRQEVILDEVRTRGGVRVSELVERLGVSDMTVRRDIEVLAGRGLVTRVHGGATAARSSVEEPGFAAKSALHTDAKQAIAAAAAALVEPGASVALSAGTTTHAVASELLDVPGLTVVTNSLRVAEVLHASGRDDMTVVLTGGVRTPSDALVGPVAVEALRGLHVDWLLMGVHGMEHVAGFTTPNLVEAETNRALVASARRTAVVADSSKWGVVGLSTIIGLDEADVVVTDDALEPGARRVIEDSCGRLVLAAADPTGSPPTGSPPTGSPPTGSPPTGAGR
jgi:DeoR/GlpR family transcriptional regulator of sugar metabolism